MFVQIALVGLVGAVVWVCQAVRPASSKICGSPEGPPVTTTRVKLRDGRHLAYKEIGVPKEKAKHKILYIHGFDQCRHDVVPVPRDVLEELGAYIVAIDRPGYGQSDPNPKQTVKSKADDVEDFADRLNLGPKFYIMGFSMGGQHVWSCLKYIPHRLAGAALLAPVANFWWRRFPKDLFKEAYNQQLVQDRWALRVSHHLPWLTYWWMTQKWFPASSVEAADFRIFNAHDHKLLSSLPPRPHEAEIRQQGEYECLHRDLMIGFGKWDFDPMDLSSPFPNYDGSVHLWQGDEDGLVPVLLQRYIAKNLPWIHYHEIKGAGHMFIFDEVFQKQVMRSLLLGEKPNVLSVK
ncbi:unnamed protein product [Victoria cruziana]